MSEQQLVIDRSDIEKIEEEKIEKVDQNTIVKPDILKNDFDQVENKDKPTLRNLLKKQKEGSLKNIENKLGFKMSDLE